MRRRPACDSHVSTPVDFVHHLNLGAALSAPTGQRSGGRGGQEAISSLLIVLFSEVEAGQVL